MDTCIQGPHPGRSARPASIRFSCRRSSRIRSAAPSRQRAAVRRNRRTLAGLGQPDEWRHRTAPISKVTTSPGKRRCSCSSRSERLVNCANTNTGPECCGGWSGAPRDPFGRLVLQRHHPEVIATETVGSIPTAYRQHTKSMQHATCNMRRTFTPSNVRKNSYGLMPTHARHACAAVARLASQSTNTAHGPLRRNAHAESRDCQQASSKSMRME